MPDGLIPNATNGALDAMGIPVHMNSLVFQGQQFPVIGARFGALSNTVQKVFQSYPHKMGEAITAGNPAALQLYGVAEGMAMLNLVGTPLPYNSTTATKFLQVMGDAQLKQVPEQIFWTEGLKALFGSKTFKSAYDEY